LMYEALDSRKTLLKRRTYFRWQQKKIAGLKLKFAPMYTLNRMGAKTDETKSEAIRL
jgi:hypothetical protein